MRFATCCHFAIFAAMPLFRQMFRFDIPRS